MDAVVITGASSGIGRATALALDELGMHTFAGRTERPPSVTDGRFSRLVLRIHGGILLVATLGLQVVIAVGYREGSGLYAPLIGQPLGYGGLHQAYALMSVVGLVLWLGASQPDHRIFHLLGLLVHLPIVLASLLFPGAFDQIADGNITLATCRSTASGWAWKRSPWRGGGRSTSRASGRSRGDDRVAQHRRPHVRVITQLSPQVGADTSDR